MPRCIECSLCIKELFKQNIYFICKETGAVVTYVIEKDLDCDWFKKKRR